MHQRKLSGHVVLTVSAVLALFSLIIVPPDASLADRIDFRTIGLLFCMMVAVAGIRESGAFTKIAGHLLGTCTDIRAVCAVLILLPTILSAFVTNDVSLLLFVPMAISILGAAGRSDLTAPVVVLQTLGANTGSMVLPFGNPQNILISSLYSPSFADFVAVTLPLAVVGAILIALFFFRLNIKGPACSDDSVGKVDYPRLVPMVIVFIASVLAVVGRVDYLFVLPIVIAVAILTGPKVLLKVDYGLLLTFFFLFIFVGNISSMDSISRAITGLMEDSALLGSAVLSQVISNVPAALALSAFTSDWQGLLAGVSIGGFGTPIASMASLISFGLYGRCEGADMGRFTKYFVVTNVVMLIVLIPVGSILG